MVHLGIRITKEKERERERRGERENSRTLNGAGGVKEAPEVLIDQLVTSGGSSRLLFNLKYLFISCTIAVSCKHCVLKQKT